MRSGANQTVRWLLCKSDGMLVVLMRFDFKGRGEKRESCCPLGHDDREEEIMLLLLLLLLLFHLYGPNYKKKEAVCLETVITRPFALFVIVRTQLLCVFFSRRSPRNPAKPSRPRKVGGYAPPDSNCLFFFCFYCHPSFITLTLFFFTPFCLHSNQMILKTKQKSHGLSHFFPIRSA